MKRARDICRKSTVIDVVAVVVAIAVFYTVLFLI